MVIHRLTPYGDSGTQATVLMRCKTPPCWPALLQHSQCQPIALESACGACLDTYVKA